MIKPITGLLRWHISIGMDVLPFCCLHFSFAKFFSLFGLLDLSLKPFGLSLDINAGGDIFFVLFKTLIKKK